MNRKQHRAGNKQRARASAGTEAIFADALRRHKAGRIDEAAQLYQQVLAVDPRHADSLHLLGVIAHQVGTHDAAVDLIGRAIALNSKETSYHSNLGLALQGMGRLDEAVTCYRNAINLSPDSQDAWNNLGMAMRDQGRLDEAVDCYRKAIGLRPNFPVAHDNLGAVLQQQGRLDEAIASYAEALRVRPDHPEGHYHLGATLYEQGKLDEAIAAYAEALRLRPDYPEALSDQGVALDESGRQDAAVACYRRAIELAPDRAEIHNNLGNALKKQGALDEAVASYRAAIALAPGYPEAHNNLGNALGDLGRPAEAMGCYETALTMRPGDPRFWHNLLAATSYRDDLDAETLADTNRRFGKAFARPYPPLAPLDPDPNRRLRIGYLSSDLRDHPVAKTLLPLLRHGDRSAFALHFYADVNKPDQFTAGFREMADRWHDIGGLADAQVAERIRADAVDILVSLAGHLDRNRPEVCAWRAAPVQISMYDVATSGLAEMDYLIADCGLVPRRTSEFFTERVLRLPHFYGGLAVNADLPPLARSRPPGPPVLGCFNNPTKITPRILYIWGRVLAAVPGARLMLKYGRTYHSAELRRTFSEVLRSGGAAAEQIVFDWTGHEPLGDFLARYNGIDLALDPTPFSGSTTSFQALSMGVPVVTLPMDRMVSRWTAVMLRSLGLGRLIAESADQYAAIAIVVAGQVDAWYRQREEIRARLLASPLCDGGGGARTIERLYRAVWRRYCAGVSG